MRTFDYWYDHVLAINVSPRQTPLRTRKQPVFVLGVCPGPRPGPRGQDVPEGRLRGDSPVFQSGPAPDRSISSYYCQLQKCLRLAERRINSL
jgi:hypothetical protein